VTETIESTFSADPPVDKPVDNSADSPAVSNGAAKKRSGGLNSLLLADLRAMAGGLGISGAGSMKKAQLVAAISSAQPPPDQSATGKSAPEQSATEGGSSRTSRSRRGRRNSDSIPESSDSGAPEIAQDAENSDPAGQESARHDAPGDAPAQDTRQDTHNDDGQNRDGRRDGRSDGRQDGRSGNDRRNRDNNRDGGNRDGGRDQNRGGRDNQGPDRNRDDEGGRRNRRRRGRDRDRSGRGGMRNEPDTQILEDDVLVPAAGILDVLDNYAFVRTSGYLPGSDDVYLSLSMVRKFGLRRGDAIVGQVRQPRDSERREKFNPMVRVDSVNGADPEAAKNRQEFSKLTPLYPSERLRLETEPQNLIGRVIDIASPIGKGQRGLIVSPSKAGKTMIMQSIANSITTNNPECHLMVVLVDERPEEVTDFERSVKGEVISSTFDRPASDHTVVAELAIERAKRLVELGHDVVVLLDGITRLGRAYNLAAPASGRILSGGVDSAALYPPKRFFGAARNIENGGSLTILATALIESGSKMDEVIFEEFKGTGNMEIRLRRDFADKRIFPAIDAVQSGTRREELLMSKEELAVVWKLRRVLSGLESQQALELLLERLKKSQSNMEFLMQVQKTTPSIGGDTD
jgi:transcription termination factor Rho